VRIFRCEDPTPGAWQEFLAAMHSGDVFECDEEMYFYYLEVLPPVWMNRRMEVPGHGSVSTFGFAEGQEPITAFWRKGGRFFGQRTAIISEGS
jgi:hypothetical protein